MEASDLNRHRPIFMKFMSRLAIDELFQDAKSIKNISTKNCSYIYKVKFKFKRQFHIYKLITNINSQKVLNFLEQYNHLSLLQIPFLFPIDIYSNYNCNGLIFSMPYCPSTLYRVKDYKETKFEKVPPLLRSLVTCLSYLNFFSIYHGNIKPSNIFIQQDGSFFISDLGVNEIRPNDYLSGEIIQFLSPEQLFGYEVSCKTDMWNIGCIIYYMLTQKFIFTFKNLSQITKEFKECDLLHFPDLPIKYQLLLKRLIRFEPDKRLTIEELKIEFYLSFNKISYNSFKLYHNPVFRIDNKLFSIEDIPLIASNAENIHSIKYILTGLANSYVCTGEMYYIFIIVNILWYHCSNDRKECVKKIIEKCNNKYKYNQISLAIISSIDRSHSLTFTSKMQLKKQLSMFYTILSNNIVYLSLLQHLDLSCFHMSYEGVKGFFDNIKYKKLTILALPRIFIYIYYCLNLENEIDDYSVKLLVDNLSNLNELQVLDLSLNSITDVGAKYISSNWNYISKLDTLDLTSNNINEEGGISLSELMLHYNINQFKYLGLVNNKIGDDALLLFKSNLYIFIFDDDKERKVLDLEGMNVGDKTMETIMNDDDIKETVTDIIFKNNNLTIEGLNYFTRNYTQLTLLKRLYLAGNKNIKNNDLLKKINMMKKEVEISNS